MLDTQTWNDPLFRESLGHFAILMALVGTGIFFNRKKSPLLKAAWASWISWCIAFPVLALLLALEGSWSLVGFVGLSIFGIREFYRITGMYDRYWYVWMSYIAVIATGLCIHFDYHLLYNLIPMILLYFVATIPIIQNEYKQMLQLISLSIIGYMMLGWGFLHLGWLAKWEFGARHLLLIILLTELCDTMNLGFSRIFGKTKWFAKIAPRRTIESFGLSFFFTLLFAFGLRHLLPERTEIYWISAAIAASLVGGLGDIVLSGFRRDINVKDRNTFIFGRSGVLDRLDRMIFVAPLYYYILKTLQYLQL